MLHGTTAHRWDTGITLDDLLVDGQWHHVVVVRQADGTMSSYLDGVLHKPLDPNAPEVLVRQPGKEPGHLNIGADREGRQVYRGSLADVRVYDRALSDAEVIALPDDPGLIGHWTFDGTGWLATRSETWSSLLESNDTLQKSGVWKARSD